MKRILYFIFSLLVISFASCTDEEDIVEVNKSNKISFFVDGNSNYKGTILTNTNLSKFNVFAYSSTNLMSPTTSLSPYINNLIVTKTSGLWNYTGCYYWPEDGFIQFFAVASDENNVSLPTGVSNWTIGTTGYPSFSYQTNSDVSLQKDLVVATSIDKNKDTLSPVNMKFQHILTQISISCILSKNTGTTYRMEKIELLGVETTAKYSFDSDSGSWNIPPILPNPTNLILLQNPVIISGAYYTDVGLKMFIIPQKNLTLKFTFSKNGSLQTPQTKIIHPAWKGKNLRYNVLIKI